MKPYLFSIGLCLAMIFGLGASCRNSRLEPGGAYSGVSGGVTNAAPDLAFFQVDSAFDLAYSAIDAAFKFEKDNRAALWALSPNIKHSLDKIRPQAAAIVSEYLTVRAVYVKNPVPANLSALQTVLAKLQQLSLAATAALPKGK